MDNSNYNLYRFQVEKKEKFSEAGEKILKTWGMFFLGWLEELLFILVLFHFVWASSKEKDIMYVRSAIEDLAFTSRSSRVTIGGYLHIVGDVVLSTTLLKH